MSNAGRPTNWRQMMSALPPMGRQELPTTGIQAFDRAVASAWARQKAIITVGTEKRVEIGHNSTHEWVACVEADGSARVLVSGPSFDDDGVESFLTREVKVVTESDMPFYIGHW